MRVCVRDAVLLGSRETQLEKGNQGATYPFPRAMNIYMLEEGMKTVTDRSGMCVGMGECIVRFMTAPEF